MRHKARQDKASEIALVEQDGLVPSRTLFRASVSLFFAESEEHPLPIFTGESTEEHIAVWQALKLRERAVMWRKAAVAASAVRRFGQRDGGPTPLQALADAAGVGREYVSRLATTYEVFNRQLCDLKIIELLRDPWFSFTHYRIAATLPTAPMVKDALEKARLYEWSSAGLERYLAAQKDRPLLADTNDGTTSPEDEDENLTTDLQSTPELCAPSTTLKGTHEVKWLLTKTERREFGRGLRELAPVLGTTSDVQTIMAIVKRARTEWTQEVADLRKAG